MTTHIRLSMATIPHNKMSLCPLSHPLSFIKFLTHKNPFEVLTNVYLQ